MSTSAELYMHTLPVSTMMNMTCPEDFQLTLNNQTALHNIQALQAGNFLLQSYNGSSPYPGQLLLQGYPGSSHISQLLNTNSLAAVSTQSQLSQLSYPTPAVVDKAAAAAAAAAAAQTKKFRPPLKSGSKTNKYIPKPIPQELGNLKTYSNPDILICGNCRELFSDLVDMLEHKKNYCKMRFTCKCELGSQNSAEQHNHSSISNNSGCEDGKSQGKRVYLKCTHCKEVFSGAWDLMFHVQSAHSVNIYSLGDSNKKVAGKECTS